MKFFYFFLRDFANPIAVAIERKKLTGLSTKGDQVIMNFQKMKRSTIASSFTSLSLLFASTASSVPSPYGGKFSPANIVNDTSSLLLRDHEQSRKIWVMPPNSGSAKLSNFMGTANIGYCDGLKSMIQATNSMDKRFEMIWEEEKKNDKITLEKREAWELAVKELSESKASPQLADYSFAEDHIRSLQKTQNQLAEERSNCSGNYDYCEKLADKIFKIGDKISDLKDQLYDLKMENYSAVREYERLKKKVDFNRKLFNEHLSDTLERWTKIQNYSSSILQMYGLRAKLEGGFASINYQLGWTKNINDLKKRNSSYSFYPIHTRNARLNATIIASNDAPSFYESLPAILDYTINGLSSAKFNHEPIKDFNAIPERIVGTLRLSLVGACPLADKNFFRTINPDLKSDRPSFGISASYDYEATFKSEVTVSYNIYEIFKLIKKGGTKGGFFSSRAYKKVIEDTWSHEHFNVQWTNTNVDEYKNFDERMKIETEIKKLLLDRTLSLVARPTKLASTSDLNASKPPKNGASELAAGLTNCSFEVYCQAGSWILSASSRIWGSSSQKSSFERSYNKSVSERWSADMASLRPGIIVYGK